MVNLKMDDAFEKKISIMPVNLENLELVYNKLSAQWLKVKIAHCFVMAMILINLCACVKFYIDGDMAPPFFLAINIVFLMFYSQNLINESNELQLHMNNIERQMKDQDLK